MPPTEAAGKEGSTPTEAAECVWLAQLARWPEFRLFVVVVVKERLLLRGWNRSTVKTTSLRQSTSTRFLPNQNAAAPKKKNYPILPIHNLTQSRLHSPN